MSSELPHSSLSSSDDPILRRAAYLIRSADVLIITAGAGLGRDSGLSTYAEFGDNPVIGSYAYHDIACPGPI